MLNYLSSLFAGILLVMVSSLAGVSGAQAMMLDRVLVVVNDDIITYGEYEAALNAMRKKLESVGEQIPPEKLLKERVLEQLVFEKLLQLHAADTGINVTDSMLDQAMKNLAKQNNMSVQQLLAQLKKDGFSVAEFKENLKDQLLVQRVIDRDVKGSISVLESEVDGVLRNVSKAQPDRAYNVSNIQLPVNDDATAEELEKGRQRGNQLRQRILSVNVF
jgi:peptidyl-prolyl cis-trans isomerase SurA